MTARHAPALALLVLSAACVSPIVAPLRYEPVSPAPEEPFRAAPPDASPVAPNVPLAFRVTTLANGLRVVLVERHGLPIVATRIVVARGFADARAPLDTYGILHRLLEEGTARRSAEELAAAYARLGAPHRVFCEDDGVTVGTVVDAADLDEAVGLLAETVLTPRLGPNDVTDARRAWLRDFTVAANYAGRIVSRNVYTSLYGRAHPYGFARPPQSHTDGLTPEDFAALHARLFHPAHTTLIVVGDAMPAAVDAVAARWLGGWAPPEPAMERRPMPEPLPGPRVVLVVRRVESQVNASIAARGPAANEEDLPAMDVLAHVLGDVSSRLRGEVRVASGAAYIFGSRLHVERAASTLTVSGAFDAQKVVPALRTILDTLAETRARGVREPDFERARTTLLAEWRAQFSTADGLAAALDQAITRGLSLEAFAAYPDRVQAVTRADVQRVARRYLGDEALHIVVSGSDEVLRPLAGLGLGAPVRRDLWAEAEGP